MTGVQTCALPIWNNKNGCYARKMPEMSEQKIEELSHHLVEALVLSVQKKLGQRDGGVAGSFLDDWDTVESIVTNYIKTEIAFLREFTNE